MTVDEFMKTQEPDQVVALGANAGCNYIFIGTVKEYEEKIDAIYGERQKIAQELINENRRTLEALGRGGVPIIDITIFEGRYDDPLSMIAASNQWLDEVKKIDEYSKLLIAHARKAHIAATDTLRGEKLKKAKSYRVREIIEVYPSITEDKTIVIFDGDERGKYWDRSETLKGRKSKKHGSKKDPGNNGAR